MLDKKTLTTGALAAAALCAYFYFSVSAPSSVNKFKLSNSLRFSPFQPEAHDQTFAVRSQKEQSDLGHLIAQMDDAHPDLLFAVYYKNLETGLSLGIRENEPLKPGSILKAVGAIGYLKAAERNADLLDQQIPINDPAVIQSESVQGVKPAVALQLHQSYSIRELIRRSLVYSDNAAAVALERFDARLSLLKTANDLRLPVSPDSVITLKSTAGFFEAIYQGAYLSKRHSNWLLDLLRQSEFHDGLAQSLPSSVPIAHKFGEGIDHVTNENFLTECGIIYNADEPYLLCASVRGQRRSDLRAGYLAKISQYFYIRAQAAAFQRVLEKEKPSSRGLSSVTAEN